MINRTAVSLLTVLFWLLLLLAVLTALASFTWPFGWDQGIFAWVGDVIYRGGLPYVDGWDIKGPLVYYIYACAEWVFGRHAWSIRVLDLFLLLSSATVFLRLLQTWTSHRIAAWSTLLFVLWYASGSYWHTAQPDGWVMMLMIPVAALLLRPADSLRLSAWFVAGVLIGAATLVKFFYAGFLLVPAVAAVTGRCRPAELSVRALLCAAGFLLPLLLTAAWFWQQGALDTFVEVTLRYPADTYSLLVQQGIEARMRGLVEYLTGGTGVAVILPLVVFGLVASWRRSPVLVSVLVAWILVATLLVVIQNRYFAYHWLPLLPALVFSAALGAYTLFDYLLSAQGSTQAVTRLRGSLAASLLLVLTLHVSLLPALEVMHWGAYIVGLETADDYHRHFGSPADDIAMAELVRSSTEEDDQVVVFGWNSAILFLSGRRSPTRFGFSMPLMQGSAESRWFVAYRDEFMQALYRQRPAAIVVGTQSDRLLGATYTLSDFLELDEFVRRYYDTGQQAGALTLYLRLPESP